MAKAIFHAHSSASRDAAVPLQAIEKKLAKLQVTHLFLTDHNRLTLPTQKSSLTYIPSEEINAKEGEIIGIFLKEEIPPGLSIKDTLAQIHAQGGLAVLPHPFDRLRSKVLPLDLTQKYLDHIDSIEVFNARTVFPADNEIAYSFAKEHKKPMLHGSDAHTLWEYGNTWMDKVDCRSPHDFLKSLKHATIQAKVASLFVHGVTKYVKWQKRSSQ